ncbi:MAG: twin-arginine translocation signal domain-containing protein, partial [Candidatus Sulfotelmatobacter sp.]
MTKENLAPTASPETTESLSESPSKNFVKRRSFLKGLGVAGAALTGGSLLAAASETAQTTGIVTSGDVALLRFVAAAELIETDMWQQYAELGGLTPGQLPVETAPFTPMNSYQAAFMNLDPDGPQYISSNTNDELTHAEFLNAYLI